MTETTAEAPASAPRAHSARRWARRVAPPVIVGAVLVALVRSAGPARVAAALHEGHLAPLLPIALLVTAAVLPLVAMWDLVVLRAALGGGRFADVLRAKAAAAPLLILNSGAAGGAYALWIARRLGARPVEAVGVVLYVVSSDLAAVSVVALGAMLAGTTHVPLALRVLPAGCVAAVVGLAVLARAGVLRGRLGPLEVWRRVPLHRGLLQLAGRSFNNFLIVVAASAMAHAFGLAIPTLAILGAMPFVLIAVNLPIVNIAGIGASQGAWVFFFSAWASPAEILAFSFVWQLAMAMALVLRGLPFVRRVVAEIDEGRAATTAVAAG